MESDDSVNLQLESAWDPNGFLGSLREGVYLVEAADDFLKLLESIPVDNSTEIDRRLLTLLWFIPTFTEWQIERVKEKGYHVEHFDSFRIRVVEALYRILGVP